ncbi:MAG: NAD(P)/FAD-dependent oxidoreductase [Candidatus Heimdallarchaeaceae archaeon]
MNRIIVIGGGFSGLTIANKLTKKARKYDLDITLIEPKDHNFYEPDLVFYAFNNKKMSKLYKLMHKLVKKKVNLIGMRAKKVETEKKKVILEDGTVLYYDYLILATGVKYIEKDFKYIEQQHIHNFYSPSATEKFRQMIKRFNGGTIVISPSTVPYKCPPDSEEFTFILDSYLKKRKLRDKTTIKFLYPLSVPFTVKEAAVVVAEMYKKRGIEFVPYCNYEKVDIKNNKFISFEGEEIEYDELVLLPIHEGQDVIKESGLGDKEGYIPTDKFTLQVKGHPNIYAIGDCTDLLLLKLVLFPTILHLQS